MEGLSCIDKKGNRISMQGNGILLITPKGKSTMALSFSEVVEAVSTRPNAPLSLKELREMSLHEWFWVEILSPSGSRKLKSSYYCKFEELMGEKSFCCGWPGTIFDFAYEEYGWTWLVYPHKPEG